MSDHKVTYEFNGLLTAKQMKDRAALHVTSADHTKSLMITDTEKTLEHLVEKFYRYAKVTVTVEYNEQHELNIKQAMSTVGVTKG